MTRALQKHVARRQDQTFADWFAELRELAGERWADVAIFLDNLIKAVPYKIHTVLTDYGIQFTKREGTEAYWTIPFDRLCDALGIEHRLTKISHPWTNGQVERMNRTIKEATVNFAKRLKTLKGLTPYEYICKIWTTQPKRFTINPFQHNVGLNS